MHFPPVIRSALRAGLVGLAAAACGTDPIEPPEAARTLDARITNGDTTLLKGETALIVASATYRDGTGVPDSVSWYAADTTVLAVTPETDGRVTVGGRRPGTSFLVARINGGFVDTVTVAVVDTGAVRWRRSLAPGTAGWDLAIGDQGQVVATDAAAQVIVFGPLGDTLWSGGGCFTLTGPSITGLGVWSSGTNCTTRFTLDGGPGWSVGVGGPDNRLAVAPDGDAIVLSRLAPVDSVLTLTRYGASGSMVWQDTLRRGGNFNPRMGTAIAANGDIYAAFQLTADSAVVARFTSAGERRWISLLPATPSETAPAVVGDRVYLVHHSGVSVRDSSGAVVYDRPFTDVWDYAPAQRATPPIVDGAGNVYVQLAVGGLFSLSSTGAIRWAADSLKRGGGTFLSYNSGPSILEGDDALVLVCLSGSSKGACGVDAATGAVLWRGPALPDVGSPYGGPAVGPDGTLYIKAVDEVFALWHRRTLSSTGWPTLGGNRGRSGTAP